MASEGPIRPSQETHVVRALCSVADKLKIANFYENAVLLSGTTAQYYRGQDTSQDKLSICRGGGIRITGSHLSSYDRNVLDPRNPYDPDMTIMAGPFITTIRVRQEVMYRQLIFQLD